MTRLFALSLTLLLCCGCKTSFSATAADYLAEYYAHHPVRATQLGIHGHDGELPRFDEGSVTARVVALKGWRRKLQAFDAKTYDHQILSHAIAAELIELERVKSHRHNPMLYNRTIGRAVSSLIDRTFAPLDVRLDALSDRLARVPVLLATARESLVDVPPLWAEMALKLTRDTASFLETKLPAALEQQGLASVDAARRSRWTRIHRRAVVAVKRHADFLERDVLPKASGDFRLGRALFEDKLRYEEHVRLDVDQLKAMNEAEITRYQAWVARVAAEIDPDKPTAQVVAELVADHPPADGLLDAARNYVTVARDFIVKNNILTLPTDTLPIVRATPEYARTGFASMSTPGPFETRATEAYYNVTNVDPSWSADKQEQHLTYFNHPGLMGISVHEAMPGHFVQLLYVKRAASDLRRVFLPASLTEGWAHYCEQMMVDEGLGQGDPRIRLGQLRRALQRHARWYAGIALHVDGRSIEEVAARFAEIAYFAPFPALRETQRGSYNPTYLYYALGRMQLLKLRADYKKFREHNGDPYSLSAFHDALLELSLPISLSRDAMIR